MPSFAARSQLGGQHCEGNFPCAAMGLPGDILKCSVVPPPSRCRHQPLTKITRYGSESVRLSEMACGLGGSGHLLQRGPVFRQLRSRSLLPSDGTIALMCFIKKSRPLLQGLVAAGFGGSQSKVNGAVALHQCQHIHAHVQLRYPLLGERRFRPTFRKAAVRPQLRLPLVPSSRSEAAARLEMTRS